MIKEINTIFNAIDIPSGEGADFSDAKKAIEDAKSQESLDRVAKSSGIPGVEKVSDVKSAAFKALRNGTGEKVDLDTDPKASIKALDSLSSTIAFIKGVKADINIIFKKTIAAVEAEEKEANNNAKEEGKGGYSSVVIDKCKAKAILLNKTLNIAVNISNASLTAVKEDAAQSRNEIMKAMSVIKKGNKSSNSEAQNNSALDSLMNSLGM